MSRPYNHDVDIEYGIAEPSVIIDNNLCERRRLIAETGCNALVAIDTILSNRENDSEIKLEQIKTILSLASDEMLSHIKQ